MGVSALFMACYGFFMAFLGLFMGLYIVGSAFLYGFLRRKSLSSKGFAKEIYKSRAQNTPLSSKKQVFTLYKLRN